MIVCAVSTALLAAAIVAALLGSVERSTGGLLAVASLCGLGYGLLLAVQFQDDARRGSHLLWGVGLPMTALAIMLVVVSRNLSDPSWQGLALNLSATAIGVLITVFYLENVLRWHEQDRWATSETIILQELVTETSHILTFLEGLHGGTPAKSPMATVDKESGDLVLDEDYLRFLRRDVHDQMHASLTRLTNVQWAYVAQMLGELQQKLERFLALYQARLSAEAFTSVTKIINDLAAAQTFLNLRPTPRVTPVDMVSLMFQVLIRDCLSLVTEHWDEW
jgi:hypothetical protein